MVYPDADAIGTAIFLSTKPPLNRLLLQYASSCGQGGRCVHPCFLVGLFFKTLLAREHIARLQITQSNSKVIPCIFANIIHSTKRAHQSRPIYCLVLNRYTKAKNQSPRSLSIITCAADTKEDEAVPFHKS